MTKANKHKRPTDIVLDEYEQEIEDNFEKATRLSPVEEQKIVLLQNKRRQFMSAADSRPRRRGDYLSRPMCNNV